MADDIPRIVYDIECQFRSGEPLTVHVEEYRGDLVRMDDRLINIHLKPEDGVTEEILIHRAELAYMRTLRRELKPEVTTQDAGTTRIISPDVH